MTKCTKQVATIGPASESLEQLQKLIVAGMDIARFNTKHNVPEWHLERMQRVKKAAKNVGKPTSVLLDLQGPEIRISIPDGKEFHLAKDEEMLFTTQASSNPHHEAIIPQTVIDSLKIGNQILLADGSCELEVTAKTRTTLCAKALEACTVKDRKTMNTPGIVLEMPALTAKDLTYLDALHRFQIEFVALSFVRSSHDVTHLRAELEKRGLHAAIIAKIENQAAIDNLDSIIEVSDGIMVARGDLGVELPFEEVPFWQKEIVRKCRSVRKPVITATQMLLSMVNNPRPSRAEVNDVANAVYDGSDAVMLSEESAQGNWPIKAVETQAKIVRFYEQKRVAAVSQSLEEVAAPVQKLQNFLRTSSKPIDAVAIYGASTKQMTQLAELRLPFPLVFIQPELTHVALNLHYGIYHCNAESPHAAAEQIVQQRILTSGQNLLILIIGNWANQSQQSLSILTV